MSIDLLSASTPPGQTRRHPPASSSPSTRCVSQVEGAWFVAPIRTAEQAAARLTAGALIAGSAAPEMCSLTSRLSLILFTYGGR